MRLLTQHHQGCCWSHFWRKPPGCSGTWFPSTPNLHLLIPYSSLRMTLKSVSGMPRSFPSPEVWFPQSLAVILWQWATRCEAAAARAGPLQAEDAPVLVSPLEMSPVKSLHSSRTSGPKEVQTGCSFPLGVSWCVPASSWHILQQGGQPWQSSVCAKPWSSLLLQDTECRAKSHDWTSKIEFGLLF